MPEVRQQRREPASAPRWSKRTRIASVIGVVIVAGLAALYSSYRISVTPPSVHAREVQFSAAVAQIEVDTPVSELVDRRQDLFLPLTKNVAVTDALYLQSAGVTQAAARAAGIPGQKVQASGPFTLLLNLDRPPTSGPPGPTDPRVNTNYRLLVDVNGAQPMISIYAQAPTTKAAIAIVDTARDVLLQHVSEVENGVRVPAEVRVTLRPLGPTRGGVVDPGAELKLMVLVFAVVLVLGLAAMHWLEYRRRNKARIAAELAELDLLDDVPARADDWPHTTRVLPWLVAIFLAMIFLVPIDAMSVPLHLGAEGNPDRVLLLLTVGLWIPVLLVGSRKVRPTLRFTRIHLWVLVFLGLCFLSVAVNGNTLAIYTEVSPTVKKLLLLVSFVMFFVLASSIIRPREVPKLVGFMVILGVIVAVATIIESIAGFSADDLYMFRLYSVGAQLILWATIGLGFAPMANKLLSASRVGQGASNGVSDVVRLTFVSHAMTDAMSAGRFPTDEPLNAIGQRQARRVDRPRARRRRVCAVRRSAPGRPPNCSGLRAEIDQRSPIWTAAAGAATCSAACSPTSWRSG